jgi:hypothetical protein
MNWCISETPDDGQTNDVTYGYSPKEWQVFPGFQTPCKIIFAHVWPVPFLRSLSAASVCQSLPNSTSNFVHARTTKSTAAAFGVYKVRAKKEPKRWREWEMPVKRPLVASRACLSALRLSVTDTLQLHHSLQYNANLSGLCYCYSPLVISIYFYIIFYYSPTLSKYWFKMGNRQSLEDEMINLRMVSKTMNRSSKKCEKNEKAALDKLKKVS